MPIKIPDTLPATKVLEKENIFTITNQRADRQDIRPLRIAILNLMPTKIVTETQLLRLISNTPLQIEPVFLNTKSYVSTHTPQEHFSAFYKNFYDICDEKFDGLIITGAPVETMPFEEVAYWDELCEVMEWSKSHVFSTFHICWGAQAALYYHYGIPKYALDEKISGVFTFHSTESKRHRMIMRGFDEYFNAPQSRYTTVLYEDVKAARELDVLAVSEEAGVGLVASKDGRQVFSMGHFEYDCETLDTEYRRDVERGLAIAPPKHYYVDDDPAKPPKMTWRAHANLLFSNWLNYYVYQETPYDIAKIKKKRG